ncbi:MAG TPA: NYN domain-containing protein [Vicinamibacteria bacterium]|nr:NYN domain-containing protein [Vicinamibacteria bacterium]HRB12295.1 NYN domain-containing protein [Vicinamibacteria bacterium]
MPYLVDGNNLAHALGLSIGGLADREACARVIASFCRSQGARATVVFDGQAPDGAKARTETHRVRILFSGGRSADEVILGLVGDSKAPRDFTVVTSDKSLGDKARHRGASVERAHEFSRRLERRGTQGPQPSEKPSGRESSDEIDAWLAVFDPGRK